MCISLGVEIVGEDHRQWEAKADVEVVDSEVVGAEDLEMGLGEDQRHVMMVTQMTLMAVTVCAKGKQARGQIVAVGNGRVDKEGNVRALDVKKGDEVLFGKYAGTEIKVEGEDRIILKEDEILAVVEK